MKKKILSIGTILVLVLSLGITAVPAGPVLALIAPPAAAPSSPSAAAVPGSVWAWGSKGATGLGDGTVGDKKIPVQVTGLSGVVDIAAGTFHALAVKSDGSVWAWGLNSQGQLGDGTTTNRNTPVPVSGLSGVLDIAAGSEHSLAVTSDKYVWAWGYNNWGQLGQGGALLPGGTLDSVGKKLAPVKVVGLMPSAMTVAAGGSHSLAIISGPYGNIIWCWGANTYGQLGDGTRILRSRAVENTNLYVIEAIAAGKRHSLALAGGKVFEWGYRVSGDITNNVAYDLFPTPVFGLTTGVTAIATGDSHSLAVKSNGSVWAWGTNTYGQLGDNTTTTRNIPVQVKGLSGVKVKAVAAGASHSLALTEDGSVWAWGYNYYGQLGDNTTTNTLVPVQISSLSGVTAIAASNFYSLALKADPPPLIPVITGPAPIPYTPPPTTPAPTTPALTPIPKTTSVLSEKLQYVTPAKLQAPRAGGVFTVAVWVVDALKITSPSQIQLISSGDVLLQWDVPGLEVISVVPGDAFGANPLVVQSDFVNVVGNNGQYRLVVARSSGSSATSVGASGPLTLAIIKLRVKSPVVLGLNGVGILETKLADANGQDIGIDIKGDGQFSWITVGKQEMGDLDGNGLIDYRDLGIFAGAYGSSLGQNTFKDGADFNGDGLINYLDLAIFGANYGK